MHLFVTSSPYIDGADRAILSNANHFVDRIRAVLPPYPNVLFVCSNPDTPEETDNFGRDICGAIVEAGIAVSKWSVLDGRNEKDAQLLIWQSDLIVLAGGHVPTQNLFFQKISLGKLLKNYQGVILGISAGSMNCARRAYAQPEEPGESRPDFRRFYPGLGLSEINILPHYQQVKDRLIDGKRLFEDVTYIDSIGNNFLSLVDGSYVLERGGETTLYGEAYAITDGKFFQISHEDEIVPLG